MSMAVLVVLPWVPVAPMAGVPEVMAASSSGRRHTGIPSELGVAQLEVSLGYRRRGHDEVDSLDALGAAARPDLQSQVLEGMERRAALHVAAGHPVPHLRQQLGQTAHPGATGADDVNGVDAVEVSHGPPPSVRR